MNLCFITARLLAKPNKLGITNIIKIPIHFPHSRNYFARVTALASGQLASKILEFYTYGDYVIIEGEMLILKSVIKETNIFVKIIDIHPADLIISEIFRE